MHVQLSRIRGGNYSSFQDSLQAFSWQDYCTIAAGLDRLLEPYIPLLKFPGRLSAAGATFPRRTILMELVSRLLWGAVPLSKGSNQILGTALIRELQKAIEQGCDPQSSRYWGDPDDYSQLLVEMPAIAFAILLQPEVFWKPFNSRVKQNLIQWLSFINKRALPPCNWQLFPLLVNGALLKIKPEMADVQRMKEALKAIQTYRIEEGWYNDGDPRERRSRDYYIPWAYYFFGQLFTHFLPDFDRNYSQQLKAQSIPFAREYRQWFDAQGRALPFGRSLTYRYAQSAFWSVQLFTDNQPLPRGELKSLWLSNLRWWMQQPIFSETGVQQVGYRYPNLYMSERYNSPASPLWSLQSFLPLAAGPEAAFWKDEERPGNNIENQSCQEQTGFLFTAPRDHSTRIALSTGQWTPGPQNEHNHFAEKYEKFSYSTHFGFNISLDRFGLDKSAPDNMLLLSRDGHRYYEKKESFDHRVTSDYCRSSWIPMRGVKVTLWQIPRYPWICRYFQVESDSPLNGVEGGFPLPFDDEDWEIPQRKEEDRGIIGFSRFGGCGIRTNQEDRNIEWLNCGPNSNILHPHCGVPLLTWTLHEGSSQWMSFCLAEPDREKAAQLWETPPEWMELETLIEKLKNIEEK